MGGWGGGEGGGGGGDWLFSIRRNGLPAGVREQAQAGASIQDCDAARQPPLNCPTQWP